MVQYDQISDMVRQKIVDQALPLISQHDRNGIGAPGQELELGPSLYEEILTLDAIRNPSSANPELTGQTISLILVPGEHPGLGAGRNAGSIAFGHIIAGPANGGEIGAAPPDNWTVAAVSASSLSTRIQDAIMWINEIVEGNPLVRVLSVPAYHINALSIYRSEVIVGIVVLIDSSNSVFDKRHIYAFDDFMDRLRQLPPALGLTIP